MISKVLGFALLVAFSQAIHNDHNTPTSFVSFNDNHNTVQHILSAPQYQSLSKYAPKPQIASYNSAPVVAKFTAPTQTFNNAAHFTAPVAVKFTAPTHNFNAAAHFTAPAAVKFTAPTQTFNNAAHFTAPAVVKYTVPTQTFNNAAHFTAPAAVKYTAAPSHNFNVASLSSHQVSSQYAAPARQIVAVAQKAVPTQYTSFSSLNQPKAPVAQFAPISHQAAPAVYAPARHEEKYAPAQYEFFYGVEDHHTGDIHSHKEARKGDFTQGEYSLHEADGTIRTVRYTVEGHSGFNAVVEKSGHAQQAQVHQPIKVLAVGGSQYHH